MADTGIQIKSSIGLDIIDRLNIGSKFSRERLPLRSGGVFDLAPVGETTRIVANDINQRLQNIWWKQSCRQDSKLHSNVRFLTIVKAGKRAIVLRERTCTAND